jgi:hypothetical protein
MFRLVLPSSRYWVVSSLDFKLGFGISKLQVHNCDEITLDLDHEIIFGWTRL